MPKGSKVSYFYDPEIGNYYYGEGHPMKPHRMRMTHALLLHYGLYGQMDVYQPTPASASEMAAFHAEDYISFVQQVTLENQSTFSRDVRRFNVGEMGDCPLFDGLFQFCAASAGGSIGAAQTLASGMNDVAINWSGGLHHAKKSEASGFCYVNDIVLGILELLKVHRRVLYVDIDVHHGDGVEEAFYTTDRVMTVSFHKYGNFFPGTGALHEVGVGAGKYHSVNVPLKAGMNDASYEFLFKPIMDKVMEVYNPDAIVLQCGADSLAGDRLGCFNLSLDGHASCIRHMHSFGKPLMLLGGGGYTIRNVARAWTYETAAILGAELSDDLPQNPYYEYYGPDYKLRIPTTEIENLNDRPFLEEVRARILDNLRRIASGSSASVGFGSLILDPFDVSMRRVAKEDVEAAEERAAQAAQASGRVPVDLSFRTAEPAETTPGGRASLLRPPSGEEGADDDDLPPGPGGGGGARPVTAGVPIPIPTPNGRSFIPKPGEALAG